MPATPKRRTPAKPATKPSPKHASGTTAKVAKRPKPPANSAGAPARKKKPGGMFGAPAPAGMTPAEYIAALPEPRRAEIAALDALIRKTCPALAPAMYGAQILGYGPFHYKYPTGREGDAYRIALSSRAQYISLYCLGTTAAGYVAEQYKSRLPKADIGKSCVRFKKLADVDVAVLADLLKTTETSDYGGN